MAVPCAKQWLRLQEVTDVMDSIKCCVNYLSQWASCVLLDEYLHHGINDFAPFGPDAVAELFAYFHARVGQHHRQIHFDNIVSAASLSSSTWIVYLHTPSVFHSLMVLSRDPDTIWRLSAENATLNTSFVWPTKRRVVRPLHRHNTN